MVWQFACDMLPGRWIGLKVGCWKMRPTPVADVAEKTLKWGMRCGICGEPSNDPAGICHKKAHEWLQENALMYRGNNASDCMIAAFIAGFEAATGTHAGKDE